jgi:hypothetical protein
VSRAGLVANGLTICTTSAVTLGLVAAPDGSYEHVVGGAVTDRVAVSRGRGSVPLASAGCSLLRLAGTGSGDGGAGDGDGDDLASTGLDPWLPALALFAVVLALALRHRRRPRPPG